MSRRRSGSTSTCRGGREFGGGRASSPIIFTRRCGAIRTFSQWTSTEHPLGGAAVQVPIFLRSEALIDPGSEAEQPAILVPLCEELQPNRHATRAREYRERQGRHVQDRPHLVEIGSG